MIAERLTDVEQNPKLYPNEADTNIILELDKTNESVEVDMTEVEKAYNLMKVALEAQGMGSMVMSYDSFKSGKEYSSVVKSKNNSFHYCNLDLVLKTG